MDKMRGSSSGISLQKCLPMAYFGQILIVEAKLQAVEKNLDSEFLELRPIL